MITQEKINKEVKGIFWAVLAAIFIRIFIIDNFYVPTGSMIPTVLIWDRLFASKWNYGYSKHVIPYSPNLFEGRIFYTPPTRGEIVIFEMPNDDKKYVKRLIGLPGEKIQVKEGVLHINDIPSKLERIEDYPRADAAGNIKMAAQFIETLPDGFAHKIIKILDQNGEFQKETSYEYIVPKGHFFMMGDNRDESGDSRHQRQMGYVPEDYILSKAQFVWLSTDGKSGWLEPWKWPFSIRYSRFFQMIR